MENDQSLPTTLCVCFYVKYFWLRTNIQSFFSWYDCCVHYTPACSAEGKNERKREQRESVKYMVTKHHSVIFHSWNICRMQNRTWRHLTKRGFKNLWNKFCGMMWKYLIKRT